MAGQLFSDLVHRPNVPALSKGIWQKEEDDVDFLPQYLTLTGASWKSILFLSSKLTPYRA